MRITPYWGSSLARFAELLNKKRSSKLVPLKDFTTGSPVVGTGPLGRNTRMVLNVLKPGFLKYQETWYNRLNINVLAKLPVGSVLPVYVPSVPFKIHEILDEINFSLGLSLDPSEVENTRYSTVKTTYTLRIKDGASVAWFGTYDFKVVRTQTKISLPPLITQRTISGFQYPLGDQDPRLTTTGLDRVQELINLINKDNPIGPPLSKKEIDLSAPIAIPTTAANPYPNTKTTIKPIATGHYKDNVDVEYHRIRFDELVGRVGFFANDVITAAFVLKHFNDAYGTDVDTSDIQGIVIPEITGRGGYEVTISTLANSVKYTGIKKVPFIYGISFEVLEKLHILMNHTLPSEGYLS